MARFLINLRQNAIVPVDDDALQSRFELDAPIRTTVSVAGGVLYVNTEKTLYAIARR